MKSLWITAALIAVLMGVPLDEGIAQDRQDSGSENRDNRSSEREKSNDERRDLDSERQRQEPERNRSRDNRLEDDEVRLRYNDERNRLSIDVDEDIQFRNDRDRSGRDRGWARDGEFDLRYDTDRHDLRAAGEGTLDVDRAASAMARWWQSWWEEEKTARRSRQEGVESGARHFVREHDENDDNYLSRRELPERLRDDFNRVDRNDDGYLSQSEVRRYGEGMYSSSQRSSREQSSTTRSSSRNRDDQSWSQWWASWWSDEDQQERSRNEIAADGARAFIRQHDENNDGFLVRSEMPDRMYDEFDRLDSNGDRYLIRSEIEEHGRRAERSASRSDDDRRR